MIKVNGIDIDTKASDIYALKAEILNDSQSDSHKKLFKFDIQNAQITILNGFAISQNYPIKDKDELVFIKTGIMPPKEILLSMIRSRNSPELNYALQKSCIGVAGLGGLGSNIALSLARVGVAKLVLVDFDIVEPSNLNRQAYFIQHIGMKKTEAIKEQILQANPFVDVEIFDTKIDKTNLAELFAPCDIVCEALDNVEGKFLFLNEAGGVLKDKKIIIASGMAGYHSSNEIKTIKFAKNVYVCGDQKNEANFNQGLMAPRVAICANHEANLVLRLLMKKEV